MTIELEITADCLARLDLTPVTMAIAPYLNTDPQQPLTNLEQQIVWRIAEIREPDDPRELSEIPEIRLWFLRLDSLYPWLPFALDWKAGELGRYAAMLVPHQFSKTEGILFNPEALELFVMGKVFVLADWLRDRGLTARPRLQGMAQMLGYDLDDDFFALLGL